MADEPGATGAGQHTTSQAPAAATTDTTVTNTTATTGHASSSATTGQDVAADSSSVYTSSPSQPRIPPIPEGETDHTNVPRPAPPTNPAADQGPVAIGSTIASASGDGSGSGESSPSAATGGAAAEGPQLNIMLMLQTGARHAYRIDEKYLRSRSKMVNKAANGTFDLRDLSGYQLKELIWTDWRSEWEPRPASPSSIRLIIMGRMLEDKAALKDYPFSLDQTNVVHITVKPADLIEDEETSAKGAGRGGVRRGHDSEEREATCRCVIL